MQTAAAYVRVSTGDQLEYSPDSQIKIIRDYAKAHDMLLPDNFIFREEDGISGRKAEKRPAFMRMIGTAKQQPKPFDCILIWKFSRFARNRQDSIVYKTLLRKQLGIDVVSVSENVGDDKMSILIEALIEAMDEYYSVNLSEEVKRGMAEKASRGGVVAGAPFGYRVENGQYVISPEEGPLVQMLFREYANGARLVNLARRLNGLGVTTKRGNPMENRTIEYILRNPAYTGKIRWNPAHRSRRDYDDPGIVLADGTHTPLIDPETWNSVQARLDEQKRLYPCKSQKQAKREFMLRGLLRCSNCGSTLVMSVRDVGLQCCSYARGGCQVSHYISIHEVTEAVLALLETQFSSGQFQLLHKSVMRGTDETDRLLWQEYAKLDRVKAAYENGVDTLEEYKANKQKITAEIKRIEAKRPQRVHEEERRSAFSESHKNVTRKLRDASIPEDEKNRILRSFIDHITFNRAETSLDIVLFD